MVFSSSIFMFLFLPIVLAVYYIVNDRLKNTVLLIASLFFYSWGEPVYLLLMMSSILINYIFGLLIDRFEHWKKRLCLIAALMIDFGLLLIFKYYGFLLGNWNALFRDDITIREIALPIGISFYTFQIVSYIIDVYRKQVGVQKNIFHLGLYISLFPQLIAGPIVRYSDVAKQIASRKCSVELFASGVNRFMTGFIKKVLIADTVSTLADAAFAHNATGSFAWAGLIAYTIQIYFDFSGYSEMAIGIGKMLGFEFVENFNYPYVSKSIKEFWRRWHISLSSWFRDYVYIPLGGNRCSPFRADFNLFVVFCLTGFWHGASWNFVFWGFYYAVILLVERHLLGKLLKKMPPFLSWLYAIVIVMFGWVFFRADTLGSALVYIRNMFTFRTQGWSQLLYYGNMEILVAMTAGVIFSFPVLSRIKDSRLNGVRQILRVILFFIAILYMTGRGFSPFLYFRF